MFYLILNNFELKIIFIQCILITFSLFQLIPDLPHLPTIQYHCFSQSTIWIHHSVNKNACPVKSSFSLSSRQEDLPSDHASSSPEGKCIL